jgi:hypothetical protein
MNNGNLHWKDMPKGVWKGTTALWLPFTGQNVGRKGAERGCTQRRCWIFNASTSMLKGNRILKQVRRWGLPFGKRAQLGGGKTSRRRDCMASAVRRRWHVERWKMTQLDRLDEMV